MKILKNMEIFADLFTEEEGMHHAVQYDEVYDSEGRLESKRTFHYLTCKKCELRRLLGLPQEEP